MVHADVEAARELSGEGRQMVAVAKNLRFPSVRASSAQKKIDSIGWDRTFQHPITRILEVRLWNRRAECYLSIELINCFTPLFIRHIMFDDTLEVPRYGGVMQKNIRSTMAENQLVNSWAMQVGLVERK